MAMVDHVERVCCMCGDVGFPDKLFRCNKCRHRFQHQYCSNYYGEIGEIEVCDWCQSEERSLRYYNITGSSSSSKKLSAGNDAVTTRRSQYSGEKIKHNQNQNQNIENMGSESSKGKSPTHSPRPTTRRYKLLKDVMC